VPTSTKRDIDPQNSFLNAVRESQAAVVDVVRVWTDISQQLTRSVGLPVTGIDVAGAVDRVFDVAEQTLAAQRQFALGLAGVATRQADIAADTVAETIGTAVDVTVETVEATVTESAQQLEALPPVATGDAPKVEAPRQDGKTDRRPYEERSIEELRERARELEIEGRSTLSKDELVAALRDQRQPAPAKREPAKRQAPKQESKQETKTDRRPYEERSIEELRERARELEIEGRSTMSKDELVAALRKQSA
jgi:hypothetical protein